MPGRDLSRAEELYHAALERPPAEREGFLDEAARGDESLRREVRSLLALEADAKGLLREPAAAAATQPVGLGPGTPLGSYEIAERIGAGGMGEVFRARDTRLGRDVALKVLPDALARDPERVARLDREARALATLNHPNVEAIHGLEELEGRQVLVLELVPGETLAQLVGRGPIGGPEALRLALQIAEGLEAAHRKGVLHRDLKPANVKITPEGQVKLLDFGLAKLRTTDAPGEEPPTGSTAADSRTRTGLILGTAGYMSPEQAQGAPLDARTDVWSFGAVLFEMLTGRRPFGGETVAEILASVLKDEPGWKRLPPATPPAIATLLRRCLEKDPRRRLHHVADARIEIEDALAAGGDTAPGDHPATPASLPRRALPPLTAALAVALGVAVWAPWRTAPATPSLRLETRLGTDLVLDPSLRGVGAAVALSPDGTTLAAAAAEAGSPTRLWVRSLDALEARPLPGTEGAHSPFFSPDGEWIGYFVEGQLRKIAVSGGASVALADLPEPQGASWGEDGTIVVAALRTAGLLEVPASGGENRTLTGGGAESGRFTMRWPQVLGDARILYTAESDEGAAHKEIVIETFPDGPREVIYRGGHYGRYLPSGHLAFVRDGTLFAAPFDLERAKLSGEPVPVAGSVRAELVSGSADYAFSDTGTLVYVPGSDSGGHPIHWLSRDGTIAALRREPAAWQYPRFSPDGDRLALQVFDDRQTDIWVYDLARDTATRLTFSPANEGSPIWTPDGRHVVFSSRRGDAGVPNIYWRAADGSGEVRRLTESAEVQFPRSWHPSGRFLAYQGPVGEGRWAVRILEVSGDEPAGWTAGASADFAEEPNVEVFPAFSPDGRFLAYVSDESGRNEVYVRPFPGPGGRWQVSTDGGLWPVWSPARPELVYGTERGEIMVAAYGVEGGAFRSARPVRWSGERFRRLGFQRSFDLHPDGDRVALWLAQSGGGDSPDSVVVVTGFFDELRRLTAEE